MNNCELDGFLPFLKKAYGTLDQPDYSFVNDRVKSKPYRGLIRQLSEVFVVNDVTSKMDDVCFRYMLSGGDSLWSLDLSMVGPFALLMRLSPKLVRGDVIVYGRDDLVAREEKVLDVLRSKKLLLVASEQLELRVKMNLVDRGAQEASLYQTLFSDSVEIPWQG